MVIIPEEEWQEKKQEVRGEAARRCIIPQK